MFDFTNDKRRKPDDSIDASNNSNNKNNTKGPGSFVNNNKNNTSKNNKNKNPNSNASPHKAPASADPDLGSLNSNNMSQAKGDQNMIDFTNGNAPGSDDDFPAYSDPSQIGVVTAQQAAQKPNPILSKLINYNDLARKDSFKPALFRDREIRDAISILTMHDHPNVLITGQAGVGKTAIAQEIARRLVSGDKLVTTLLGKDTTIYELPLSNLVAGTGIAGQLEAIVNGVVNFAADPQNHAILYIDEIHQLFKSSGSYDTIAQILKPALARGDLRVIASTTTSEAKFIKDDPAFERRFTELKLPEFTKDQMAQILVKIKPIYEKYYGVGFDENDALSIVKLAHQYGSGKYDPDLTLTMVDHTLADYRLKLIDLGLPMTDATLNTFKQSAKHLLAPNFNNKAADAFDQLVDTTFVGQDKAVDTIKKSLKMISLDLIERDKPYSMLFTGPTGTGKTQLAKTLAKALFGSEKSLVYLNMTEYSNPMSLTKLIGSSAGYVGSSSARPLPLDDLINNPYQVVLLDEFEKASNDVKQIFMQALDEGKIQTNQRAEIDFSHAIVIATSNAGTKHEASVGFNSVGDDIVTSLADELPIELLNRFENVIEFSALSKDEYKQVLKIKYNALAAKIKDHAQVNLDPESVDLDQDYDFINTLADESYNPALNGRPAERTVLKHIESKF